MRLLNQLERWKLRKQIDQSIIDVVFQLRDRLEHYWKADVNSKLVDVLLFHIACSLGRIERGGCASPLYQAMFEEMQSAVIFPQVLAIHEDLLTFLPVEIPHAEQTYFLANVYSLLLEQPKMLN
ncbi:PRD domain-containing protein [Rodentibacter trehalosifermentans]|uniref:PRD domain-containing protein n=1 Tax=Rodentibacter trehalosifermentans TaxID=1908263 RepID=A0A1V3IXX3_9PAST|nr:PRD domain-containing protein [Rodentibacter trehalosifermentans]OOF46860.1 hypothetical protein BKK51_01215 [Rodentibacter trehalosifermentans]OOF47026.1 hypothetical protein BKK52_10110 [Rodentibacter trehalosifermentans]OOF52430.1 hypothetical protein BKK53_05345 [Rodentibacter trehalosifermentans]